MKEKSRRLVENWLNGISFNLVFLLANTDGGRRRLHNEGSNISANVRTFRAMIPTDVPRRPASHSAKF
jgi:uncharacterized protein (UPF0262 family)